MNKKPKLIVAADWAITLLYVGLGLALLGYIERGGTIADLVMAMGIMAIAPSLIRGVAVAYRPNTKFLEVADWNNRAEPIANGVIAVGQRIRHQHRQTFGDLDQRGAIGRDLDKAIKKPMTRRAGRQHGGSTAARQAASSKSADDDGGDGGEPPRLPQLYIYLPLLFNYVAFALLIGCSPKTLRNKVSAGIFPPPIKTQFGPRFTQGHLAMVLTPQKPQADPPQNPKKRGRPRIALALAGKGGAK